MIATVVSFFSPDLVAYRVDIMSGPYAITLIGGAKSFDGMDRPFSDMQIGHILDMGSYHRGIRIPGPFSWNWEEVLYVFSGRAKVKMGGRGSGSRCCRGRCEDNKSSRCVWLQKVFPDAVNSDGFCIERQNLETLAIHACHSF
jgi:hypothetical protein